jgi:DNA repair photolyase
LRDLALLLKLSRRTILRVSFSITTDREDVRRLYEPHCEPIAERLEAVRQLGEAGIATHVTLAPLLPCDPERLAQLALGASERDVIGDPLHVRSAKRHGATTRDAAWKVGSVHRDLDWFEPRYQGEAVAKIRKVVEAAGRRFGVGPEAFGWLAR